jgi:hypothetical protein
MEKEEIADEILSQLKIANKLLALILVGDEDRINKKPLLLLEAGFRPVDVAELLGVPIGTVTKARSRAKGRTEH